MQTYGRRVSSGRVNPKTYFIFPIFGEDKRVLPLAYRSLYKDDLLRTGSVFCRVRNYPTLASSVAANAVMIAKGSVTFQSVTAQSSRWFLEERYAQYIVTTTYNKKTKEGMNVVAEYDVQPFLSEGVMKVKVRSRSYTTLKYFSYAYSQDSVTRIAKEMTSNTITVLATKAFSTPTTMVAEACGDLTFVFTDEQSIYAGKMYEEYIFYSQFSRFLDHRFNSAVQTAYVKAAESLPRVASNGIANCIQLVSALSALLRQDFGRASRDVGDAWLAYRYSYTTTMLDVREYSSYIQRIQNLSRPSQRHVKSHGYFSDGGFTFHVVLQLELEDILPSNISERLDQFGLALNSVNAWDLIPYSFVVDWFLPVSDLLSQWEAHWESRDLKVSSAWMSVTSPTGDCYLRGPTKWNSATPVLGYQATSDKTILMRIADAIALLK